MKGIVDAEASPLCASRPELEQDEQQNDDQDQREKSTTDNHLCVVLSLVSNPVTEARGSGAVPLS